MTQPNQGYDNTGGYGQSANPYGQPKRCRATVVRPAESA